MQGISSRAVVLVFLVAGRMGDPWQLDQKLLRALLLQVLYTVRSERPLLKQLDYNFLFRWFVGLGIDDPVWDVTVFTKNRRLAMAPAFPWHGSGRH
jgi:transposase